MAEDLQLLFTPKANNIGITVVDLITEAGLKMDGGKQLEWGQTPWDDISREHLLREVQRMYAAIVALETTSKLCKLREEHSPFWRVTGTGGRGLELARQILEPLHAKYSSEQIFRSFFRYAVDLLFDGVGSHWAVCDKCGQMIGVAVEGQEPAFGQPCRKRLPGDCDGTLRPLEWKDLQLVS